MMAKKAFVHKPVDNKKYYQLVYIYDSENPGTADQVAQAGTLTIVDGVPTEYYFMLPEKQTWIKLKCVTSRFHEWVDCDNSVTMNHFYDKENNTFVTL